MSNKKSKGFTLIELLVTILITALIMIGAIFSVREILKNSENKINKININNIKEGANQYTTEFKNEEKYWFVDNSSSEVEYSCTTVGMLINKGILKKDVIGTKINIDDEEKQITENTSIKIERDRLTKVYNGELLFYDGNCVESTEIDVLFEIKNGTIGKNNWYISPVEFEVEVTTNNKNQIASTEFKLSNNKNGFDVSSENNDNISRVIVSENGKNIDLCVTITTLKDINKTYCFSEKNEKINIDTEKPNTPNLVLEENHLISKYANDNLGNSMLTYYLYDEEKEIFNLNRINANEIKYQILTPDDFNLGKNVITYVEDAAGNISESVIKKLKIENSQNSMPVTNINWYCSLNDNVYSDESDALNSCIKTTRGNISSNTKYLCSLNNVEYSNYQNAQNNCYDTEYGTITTEYYCNERYSSSSTCTEYDTTTVNGGGVLTYSCSYTDYVWQLSGDNYTDYGCPSGYTKDSFTCGSPSLEGSSCSSPGSTTSETITCTNYCSKTSTYSADTRYYCSLGYYVNSIYACYDSTYGTINSVTRYTCDLNNQISTNYNLVYNNCYQTTTGTTSSKTTYTCPLTNNTFNSINDAKNDCTNYCSLGQYYDNKCYILR